MNHRALGRVIAGILAPLCLAALAVPASAAGRPAAAPRTVTTWRAKPVQAPGLVSVLAGYLWSTSTTNSGPVDGYYAFNGSGGAVTVTNPQTGVYFANFYGLGAMSSPAVDVTTYGTLATCNFAEGGTTSTFWGAVVECFSLGGTPVDARFDLAVGQPRVAPTGVLDYALVIHPARSGPLTGPYQYNSSHKTNRIKHLGTGRFQLTMPGPATRGTTGTVKVTPGAITPGDCEVAGWHGTRTGEVIDVDCFSATGAPQNRPFLITYVRGNNLMGLNGVTDANAFADMPSAPRYQPAIQYDSHRHAIVDVRRISVGSYELSLGGSEGPGNVNGGHVQVTAVGHNDDHCIVDSWGQGPTPVVFVSCTTNAGVPADSAFTIQWVVA